MKAKLPLIGEVRFGKDAQPIEIIKEVESKQKFFDVLGGILDLSPQNLSNEKSISTKILKANKGWVYRNNDVIAQEVSKIEFELFTVGLSGGEIVYNEVLGHPLLDLLDHPNEETTTSDAVYIIQSHRKLTGDAFWLKIRNGQQVIALRSLPPDKIILKLRNPTADDPTVIESYNYKDVINGVKIDVTYDPRDIIHFKKPNPNNAFRGYGAVEALADTIDLDNLTTETTKKFFQNGAITNFVLSTESKITNDQLKRLNAEMRSAYSGASNAYKAMILGGGMKPVDISYSNKELEFLAQLEWYRDKIMIGFGNTKASLGIVDDVNRSSYSGSYAGWLKSTVKPDMVALVNALNEYLVPEFGKNLILGFKDPVPEDRADDVTEATDMFKSGLITRNEGRELVELEPVDGGDVFFDSNQGMLDASGNPVDNNQEDDKDEEDS